MPEEFKLGDLVWAKMKGFSPWPGRISKPIKDMKIPNNPKKQKVHSVYFFGTNNYGWIDESNMKSYQEHKEVCKALCKTAAFKEACDAIEQFIANGEVFEDGVEDSESLFDKLKEENNTSVEKKTPKIKPKKDTPKAKRESSSGSEKRPAKKQRADSSNSSVGNLGKRLGSLSPALNHSTPLRKSGSLLDRPAANRPATPPLDVETMSQTLKEKNVCASTLKFGFLGLGNMGSGIVKNLLNSGHKVIVWNRTQDKCADFVKAGAEPGLTPSDVVLLADITFSCVADPQTAKEMVFGNCGVLSEITTDKGYVEMTGIDSETSEDIAEAITSKGARYLEAQVQGSKTQAEEGTLVILGAGDRQLYDDCHSCFQAMGKSTFYLGEVGTASKMNLVLQLLKGVTLASLAECMALADRAGLVQKDVLEILELTSLACPALLEKGRAIIEGSFTTHQPLSHMQKDLRLSLAMSDQLEQPLPLTAAANEIYKHAERLGYGDHDASAIYISARF